MAPASKENRHQTKTILKRSEVQGWIHFCSLRSSVPHVTSWGYIFSRAHTEAASSPDLCYEILQFLFEDDEEFLGGLCGGLKDFDRLRLLALLPPLPEAALLATE